jgi:hypothetical protein
LHVASNGWSARLYWLWILYNSVAFVVVLTAVAVLSWISADVLHLSLSNRSWVVALLVATAGALLFGGVLGALQWLVIRQRVPVPRKRWIVASVGPALLGWLFVIMPAVISAQDSGASVSGAYLLAASQTLALGPLLGLSQAAVLRGYTRRWALVDRRQHRLLAHRRRRVLPAVAVVRRARLHSQRRLGRAGVPDAHRHHTADGSHAPMGAGAVGGSQSGASNDVTDTPARFITSSSSVSTGRQDRRSRRDEQEPAALAAIRARQAEIDNSPPSPQSSNIPSACRGVSTTIGPGLRSTMLRK